MTDAGRLDCFMDEGCLKIEAEGPELTAQIQDVMELIFTVVRLS